MKPKVSLLVTDLDNTLYDWFEIWYRSFAPMLEELVRISGVPQRQLEEEIRQVHQERGTSEYSHLIQELPSLRKGGEQELAATYSSAIDAFREGRKQAMRLYDGVAQTLAAIRAGGATVVAYTESLAFYTAMRIRWLGLDGTIDYLYSPADHDFPAGVSVEDLRQFNGDHYALKATRHRHTPPGVLKPARDVLSSIID
jgi:FMN phosphatase YigB (HAD superfamily)